MEKIEDEMMNVFSRLTSVFNLGDSAPRILAILYLEPGEIAMEELAEKAGYSLSSVSNKMKLFEATGIVERVKKPGTNKAYFMMEKNLLKMNIRKLDKMISNNIVPAKEILPRIIEKYSKKVKTNEDKEKLKIVENYYKQLKDFEKLLEKWKKDLENLK
jgi:DNA-binding transcriptional regulator GbsR (MarR family)